LARRIGKYVGFALLALVALFAGAVTATIGWRPFIGPSVRPVTDRTFPSSPERLERGRYLAEGPGGCIGCHSDRDWMIDGAPPKPGLEGSGHVWGEEGLPWLTSPNITPDRETGIGAWTDDELARAIREGISRDGRALFPLMPYPNFKEMSDEDLASVIVYLRSLKPIRRSLPVSQVPFPVNRFINMEPEPVTQAVPPPNFSNTMERGRYLVRTIGGCHDCHTPRDQQGQFLPGLEYAGGALFPSPAGTAAASNITQDPSGIPYYDEALFLEVMRTGRVRARKLNPGMPWRFYEKQTDEDLKAMFAYVKTLAPVRHSVENVSPPTDCAVCGNKHGLGERNTKQ
jgi:mono/diheme cytochrome c family protein